MVEQEPSGFTASPRASARILAVLLIFVTFSLLVTVGVLSQLLNTAFGLWFTEIFGILAPAWILLRLSGRDPVRWARASFPGWGPPAFGFLIGLVNFFLVVVPIQYFTTPLLPSGWKERFDAARIFEQQTPVELALILAGISIAAPWCEEYAFRGVIQRGLVNPSRPGAGVLLTALIFSVFHLDPVGFLARVQLGVLFGVLVLKTGTIWPGVMAHAANNLLSSAIYLASRNSSPSSNDPRWQAVAALAVAGVAWMLGLFHLIGRKPSLAPPVDEDSAPAMAPPGLLALAGPWFIAAVASMAALLLLDRRGVQLTLYDLAHRLPAVDASSSGEKQERDELRKLRMRARRGEIGLDLYFQQRQKLAEHLTPSKTQSR